MILDKFGICMRLEHDTKLKKADCVFVSCFGSMRSHLVKKKKSITDKWKLGEMKQKEFDDWNLHKLSSQKK